MEKDMKNGKIIQDHNNYRIVVPDDGKALLFDWKQVQRLSIKEFKSGIAEFAKSCKTYKPDRAVIDARKLDPIGDPLGWVTGQKKIDGEEPYNTWWSKEIVPIYNEAGISVLSVATGDPNAPGELANIPDEVHFKIGYFPDLDAAMQWGKK